MPDSTTLPAKLAGAKHFTFAVLADTHLEPEADGLPRSNRRTRAIVEQIRADAPAFVLHLGDLVHPVPALPGFTGAAQAVREIFATLDCPVYMTPGNHDIGDKPQAWMPAKSVTETWIDGYREWFGAPYQAFSHAGCRFVLVNSPAFNSGLRFEAEQRAWLEAELSRSRDERLFVATHYPPYLLQRDEPSNYDNIDEPARSWFLDLLERHAAEALFVGHVHSFFYTLHRPASPAAPASAVTDFYALPSTSFVRRDYSELFRIAPDADQEYGRNDASKLGYFLVDVHEHGHLARPRRGADGAAPAPGRRLRALHPLQAPRGGVGAHLRHPWADTVVLPHNPPTDEFQRRRVRNDYTAMACWELGLRNLRVPLADLADAEQRTQMQAGARLGLRFTVFSAGLPDDGQCALVAAHAPLLAHWEVVLPWDEPAALVPGLRAARRTCAIPVLAARLHSAGDRLGSGSNLQHFSWAGFLLTEAAEVQRWLRSDGASDAVDAVLLRLPWNGDALRALPEVAALGMRLDIGVVATICLAPDDPSAANLDDAAIARRVAGAQFLGQVLGLPLFLDTFADIDRGYFVRNALVDRRFNPRAAGWLLAHQQRVLDALPGLRFASDERSDTMTVLSASNRDTAVALLLPEAAGCTLERVPASLTERAGATVTCVELRSGALHTLAVENDGSLDRPAVLCGPALLVAGAGAQVLATIADG